MFVDYPPELVQLRAELRAYFAGLLTDDVRHELAVTGESGPLYRPLIRRLGADGWLGIGWPTEYGGQGRDALAQFVFFEEAMRAGVPVPLLTLNTVGPTLMRYGTAEQKERFLPGILTGDVVVAVGYTEPESGTDLASLRTRAVRDGDGYLVTGTKVFTSHAHDADYVWLACRTDPDAPRHAGISILLVRTDAPGFSVAPIETVGGIRTNVTYYDQVRVPLTDLVGDENGAWPMMTAQLAHERVALAAWGGHAHRMWDEVASHAARTALPDGGRLSDVPWVRAVLAEAWCRLEAMKLVNWRLAGDVAADRLRPADASAGKVVGSETVIEVYRLLLEVLGPFGSLRTGSPGAALYGEVERAARQVQVNTFAGGVNEVQREIVATRGLGLPRPRR